MRLKIEKLAALSLIPAILVAEAVILFLVATGSSAVENAITEALADAVDGSCRVERVTIEPFGGVEIGEIEVTADPDAPPLVWARGVRARFTARSFLSGRFVPEEITVDDASFWIPSKNPFPPRTDAEDEPSFGPGALPPVSLRIRNGIAEAEGIPIALEDFELILRSEGDGLILATVSGFLGGGAIRASGSRRPDGDAAVYEFQVEGDRTDASAKLEPFFDWIGIGIDYRAFGPRGEVSWSFESDPFSGLPIRGRLQLLPHGASITYLGWPDGETGEFDGSFLYPLDNLNGPITVRIPGEVIIDDVEGTIGRGRVTTDGFVRVSPLARERRLVFDIRNVDIEEEIIDAMAPHEPTIADMLRELAVQGSADLVLTLLESEAATRNPSDGGGAFEATVQLRDAAICPAFFPLPIGSVTGSLSVAGDGVVFEELEGRYGDAIVTCSGTADLERIALSVSARNLTVDDVFINALREISAEGAAQVESLHLSAGRLALDLDFESFPSSEEPTDYRDGERQIVALVKVSAEGCSARPDFFRLPLDDIDGEIFLRIGESALQSVAVERLIASHAGSRIEAQARIDDGRLQQLVLSGRNQTVTADLIAAIGEAEPGAAEWIDGLSTTGSVDFDGSWKEGDMTLSFRPCFSRVESARLPCTLTGLDGTIHWQGSSRSILGEALSIGIGRGRLVLDSGEVNFLDSKTSIRLNGNGQGLDLNIGPLQLAPGTVHDLLRRLALNGIVNIKDARMEIDLDGEGSIARLAGSAGVSLDRASMEWPVKITDGFGKIDLDLQFPGEEGREFALAGDGSYLSFVLEKREFSSVHSTFDLDESGVRVTNLDGNLYGGRVTGARNTFAMSFDSPCAFNGRLKVRGADLNRLLGRAGYAFKDISGKLDYRIQFEGELENINRMTAEGRMSVEDGHLWRLPVFSTLWGPVVNIFGVGAPPAFETGSTDFTLKDGILNLENAILNSSLMTLQGSGALTVDSANVEVQFAVGPTLPIISDVISPLTGLIKQGFFNLRIAGDYDNMRVSYDSILTSPFRSGDVTDTARCPAPDRTLRLERF